MNKYKIEITETAEKDLFEISSYIANELLEPNTAKKVLKKIAESIFQLEEIPLRNPLVKDERLALQGIRKMLIDHFIVFYVVNEERKIVTIIRILYSKRNWHDLL
ncbi:type II toxin-antitoxin system RelE/ParE family toxin [Tepidibacillus marianensis]|uniref:type II toxin-antitoxin system RelE/ParE family toxin n=1 Tax=Tepidibacillus marianensis TaxID=3131995 RepID=UPI0030CF94F7